MIAWQPFSVSKSVASVRLRCLQPMLYLNQAGMASEIYNEKNIDKYTAVIFMKAYSNDDIELAQRLKTLGKCVIFDICDNHPVINTQNKDHKNKMSRLNSMFSLADTITVPTHELGKLLKLDKFIVIPDSLEKIFKANSIDRYNLSNKIHRAWNSIIYKRKALHIIWFGNAGALNPINGLYDLKRIESELLNVSREVPIRIDVISNNKHTFKKLFTYSKLNIHYHKWNKKCFTSLMDNADISLIPVSKNRVTEGKSPNRVITAFLYETTVISDLIPSYISLKEFIFEGDWSNNILYCYKNAQIVKQRSSNAKEFLLKEYHSSTISSLWISAINKSYKTKAH